MSRGKWWAWILGGVVAVSAAVVISVSPVTGIVGGALSPWPTLRYVNSDRVNVVPNDGGTATAVLQLGDAGTRVATLPLAWSPANGAADLGLDTGIERPVPRMLPLFPLDGGAPGVNYHLYAVPAAGSTTAWTVRGSLVGPTESALRSHTDIWPGVTDPGWATLPSGDIFVFGGESEGPYANHTPPCMNLDPETSPIGQIYEHRTRRWVDVGYADPALSPTVPYQPQLPAVCSLADGRVLIAGGWDVAGATYRDAAIYQQGKGFTFLGYSALNTDRDSASCTLLASGKVLIAGGRSYGGIPLATAELFDPATNLFTPVVSTMSAAHWRSPAVVLNSGKVLLILETGSAALYDPATSTFANTAHHPVCSQGVFASAVKLANGSVLIAGGQTVSGGPATVCSQIYDPATDTFTATGSLNQARYETRMVLLANGDALVAGGIGATNDGGTAYSLASAERWHAGTWSATGSMAHSRAGHITALLPDGKVLASSGNFNDPTVYAHAFAESEIYDPAAGTWSRPFDDHILPRASHVAVEIGANQLLLVGGNNYNGGVAPNAQEYDLTTMRVMHEAAPMDMRSRPTAVRLPSGNVLITGGSVGETAYRTALIYDVTTHALRPTSSMQCAHGYVAAHLLPDGKAIMAGGLTVDLAHVGCAGGQIVELFDESATGDGGVAGGWTTVPSDVPSDYVTPVPSAQLPSGDIMYGCQGGYYRPAIYRWSDHALLQTSIQSPTNSGCGLAALLNGDVLSVGPRATAAIWSHATNHWRRLAAGHLPHEDHLSPHMVTLADGRVLISGSNFQYGSPYASSEVTLFDPVTEQFTPVAHERQGYAYSTLTRLDDGRVVTAGGWWEPEDVRSCGEGAYGSYGCGVFGASANIEIYDPAAAGPDGYASWHYLGHAHNDTSGNLCAFVAPVPDGGVLCDGGYLYNDAGSPDVLAQTDAPYITDGGVVTAGEIWITDYANQNVTRLAMNGTFLGAIVGLVTPRGIVYDASARTVWVTSQGGNYVYAFSAAFPFDPLPLSPYATGTTPLNPCSDGLGHIWIPSYSDGKVTALSAEFGTPMLGSPFTAAGTPAACASDGATVWVVNYSSSGAGGVTALSATTGASMAGSPFATGSNPTSITYSSAGHHVWIGNATSQTATVLDRVGTPVAYSPVSLAASGVGGIRAVGADVWVAGNTAGNAVELLEATGASLGTATTGAGPQTMAFDGLYVWVLNTAAGTVTKVHAVTRAVIGTYAAGIPANTYGIAYVPTTYP